MNKERREEKFFLIVEFQLINIKVITTRKLDNHPTSINTIIVPGKNHQLMLKCIGKSIGKKIFKLSKCVSL